MNSRHRLLETFFLSGKVAPPRYESEFSEEAVERWRREGKLGASSPEEHFGLNHREELLVRWRRGGDGRFLLRNEADVRKFRGVFDAAADRLPGDWAERAVRLRGRDFALSASPWDEGFLQVIGVEGWPTFEEALLLLHDRPEPARAAMEHYAGYLEELLDRVLREVRVDYAVFYEPIASQHAPVVSPETYARFSLPALRRVAERLERHGVRFRFVWTAGQVRPLIPLWLEAGINGLVLRQAGGAGISYAELRRTFDARLRFFGGVDWRALREGPEAVDRALDGTVRPLLEEGGYVPHLDDTVRAEIPFEAYAYYRRSLDALVGRVFG